MRYLQITGPVRQKDGSERVETQIVRVSEAKGAAAPEQMGLDPAAATELPRMPRENERWKDGRFVEDAERGAERAREAHASRVRRGELLDRLERAEARVKVLEGLIPDGLEKVAAPGKP